MRIGTSGAQQVLGSEFGTEHLWQLAVVLLHDVGTARPGRDPAQQREELSEALTELEARLGEGQRQPKSPPCPQPVTWLLSEILTWRTRWGQASLVGASP